jgi:transposase
LETRPDRFHAIERLFSKLKHFRRVATRYDKLAVV